MIDRLIAFSDTAYGLMTLLALAFTCVMFAFSAWTRARVDAAMASGDVRKPLRLFDLSHGDLHRAMGERRMVVPERLWTYDEAYLERFAGNARRAEVDTGVPALNVYLTAILRRFDLAFAVGLGVFVVLVNLAIADALLAAHPLWARAAWLAACMGVLYAVSDVAEDLKLSSIFDAVDAADSDRIVIDPAEAAAANVLTRMKLVTIVLSGTGAVVFTVLSVVAAVFIRPPGSAAPEARPAPSYAR